MLEVDSARPGEVLTFSQANRSYDRWLQRTISRVGEHLAALRDRVLEAAQLQRHSLVLDLNAATGLLTWEALRRTPEGGVWSLAYEPSAAQALQEQAARLPEIERPMILQGDLLQLPDLLRDRGDEAVRFDAVVGRNVLTRCLDKAAALAGARSYLRPAGHLVLAEIVPRQGQRLSALVDLSALDDEMAARLREAEAELYQSPHDARVNWDVSELEGVLREAGFEVQRPLICDVQEEERLITGAHLTRWFAAPPTGGAAAYASQLLTRLSPAELQHVEACFRRQLGDQIVPWRTVIVYVTASAA
jgi:putative ATPase